MIIKEKVQECDFTSKVYTEPVDGGWVIVQGATGRWAPVMYIGPEALAEMEASPITRQEALEIVEKQGGYPDF
jgi:hypothetical protein